MRKAVTAVRAHQRLASSRLDMLRGYAETTECRRQYLLGYFGEQLTTPCANCDTCEAGTAHHRPDKLDEYSVNSAVRHADWGHGTVVSVDQDRLTVLFDEQGYRTLSLGLVREHELLSAEER